MLPDFIVRKFDAGVGLTPADEEAWEYHQALFYAPVLSSERAKAARLERLAKARAKAKAKAKGKRGAGRPKTTHYGPPAPNRRLTP